MELVVHCPPAISVSCSAVKDGAESLCASSSERSSSASAVQVFIFARLLLFDLDGIRRALSAGDHRQLFDAQGRRFVDGGFNFLDNFEFDRDGIHVRAPLRM